MRPPRVSRFGDGEAKADPFIEQLDPASQEALRRLRTWDDTPPADEEFVRRLRAQLGRGAAPDASGWRTAEVVLPNGTTPRGAAPLALPRLADQRPVRAYAELAAAALLLLAFVGALAGRDGLPTLLSGFGRDPARHEVTMFRGNPARTGAFPGKAIASSPELRWRFDGGQADLILTAPAVAGGTVFAGGAYWGSQTGAIFAIDGQSGSLKWQFATDTFVGSSPAVANGLVYAGCADGNLYAIDARTGKERWRAPLGGPVYESSPVVVDGVVYVQSGGAASSPAVVGGVVYVGGGARPDAVRWPGDAVLHAIDARTGRERWRLATGSAGVYAVDAATGTALWQFQTAGPVVRTAVAAADGAVYAVSFNADGGAGILYAIDIRDHAARWHFTEPESEFIGTSPAVADGTVYIGAEDGRLYAIDATTGRQRWAATAGNQVQSSPIVVDGVVLVGSFDGALYAFDATTGSERWRVQAGTVIGQSPTSAGGAVFVATEACRPLSEPYCVAGAIVAVGAPESRAPG
jgi:eukaryotic-like serine/threonine-protein kinase